MKLITLVQLTDSGEEEESIIAKLLTVSGARGVHLHVDCKMYQLIYNL